MKYQLFCCILGKESELFPKLTSNFLVLLLSVASQSKSSNSFQEFLEKTKKDELIKVPEFVKAIQSLDATTNQKFYEKDKTKQNMGKILNEYAKTLFYGKLKGGKPKLQKAFYFFKLASQYGNSESLYYLSFYSFYNLDGRFLYLNNYHALEKADLHGYLRNYINKMNSTTLLTNAYISSLQGYNASTFLMANLYWHVRFILNLVSMIYLGKRS